MSGKMINHVKSKILRNKRALTRTWRVYSSRRCAQYRLYKSESEFESESATRRARSSSMSPPAACGSSLPFDFTNSMAALMTSFQMSLPFARLALIDARYPFVATRQLAWLKSVDLVPFPVYSLMAFRIQFLPFLSPAVLSSVICPSCQKLRARSTWKQYLVRLFFFFKKKNKYRCRGKCECDGGITWWT